jgi:hypothetical protein
MKRNRMFLGLAALLAITVALFTMGDVGAATLTTRVGVNLSGSLAGTAGLSTPTAVLSAVRTIELANGVGASQADSVYSTTLSITTGATTDVDIKGTLLDALGTAFTPAKVKAIYIFSATANTTNLTLFGDANSVPILNTAATTATLLPGGIFLMVQPPLAGIAVTAATGDIIQIANAAGATASVDLVIVGTSS